MQKWHDEFPQGGVGKQSLEVLQWLRQMQYTHTGQVLDYGCGQGGTVAWLTQLHPQAQITGYDAHHPLYDTLPTPPFEGIYSIDVLEHFTQDTIGHTLQQLWEWSSEGAGWCHVIDTTPAKKRLSTGENAHTLLQTPQAWANQLSEWCEIGEIRVLREPDKLYGERVRVCITGTTLPQNQLGNHILKL